MIKIDEKLLRCIDGDKKSFEILDNIINRQKEIQEIFKREEKIRDTYKECILKIIEEVFLIIPPNHCNCSLDNIGCFVER